MVLSVHVFLFHRCDPGSSFLSNPNRSPFHPRRKEHRRRTRVSWKVNRREGRGATARCEGVVKERTTLAFDGVSDAATSCDALRWQFHASKTMRGALSRRTARCGAKGTPSSTFFMAEEALSASTIATVRFRPEPERSQTRTRSTVLRRVRSFAPRDSHDRQCATNTPVARPFRRAPSWPARARPKPYTNSPFDESRPRGEFLLFERALDDAAEAALTSTKMREIRCTTLDVHGFVTDVGRKDGSG